MFGLLSVDEENPLSGCQDQADRSQSSDEPYNNSSTSNLPADAASLDTGKDDRATIRRRDSVHTTSTPSPPNAQHSPERSRYDTYIPAGSWHSHTPAQIAQHRKETGVLPADAKPGTDDNVLRYGEDQSSKSLQGSRNHSPERKRVPGTIARYVDLQYFATGAEPEGQCEVLDVSSGGRIVVKHRYFLIVGRSGHTTLECPIYTFDDKGLSNRDNPTRHEYCSVKPRRWRKNEFEN